MANHPSTPQTARLRAELIMKVRCGLITARQAADQLGVSRKTFYKWEQRGLFALLEELLRRLVALGERRDRRHQADEQRREVQEAPCSREVAGSSARRIAHRSLSPESGGCWSVGEARNRRWATVAWGPAPGVMATELLPGEHRFEHRPRAVGHTHLQQLVDPGQPRFQLAVGVAIGSKPVRSVAIRWHCTVSRSC